jgi:two-component system, cell cycle sensor histidine kinase PleC
MALGMTLDGRMEPNLDDSPSQARGPAPGERSTRPQRHDGVKAARERLTNGSQLKPEFEYELLQMFARNERDAQIAIPLLACTFMLASMFWAPIIEACAWFTLLVLAKWPMVRACKQFQKLAASDVDIVAWRTRFIRLELANGIVWGGMALVGADTTNAVSHVFVFAALVVLLAIRMTFASAVLTLLYVGTIPMTIALCMRLGWQAHPFYLAMIFMAIGLHAYFIFLAKRQLHATAIAMLEFRAEKDALIAELEEAKSISDEARHRAEAANIAKSRFLATMSHELRTPLNAVVGFSEVMKTELLGPMQNASYLEYSNNIFDSGRHLLHVINEILDLSRIEAGHYELNEEPVRLADVVEDCHRLLKLRAESKGLSVELDFEANPAQIWADERALRQICLNLMSNALKFTPRGGRISLTVASTPEGGQSLTVKDTGPGIPKDEIPRVMQAFGQGSLAHRTAEGGTGLGLPIVQSLVELHGGTFELQSEMRKGTAAVVKLPKSRVLSAMPPLQPLGQERHRQVASGPALAVSRPPRPARLRAQTAVS